MKNEIRMTPLYAEYSNRTWKTMMSEFNRGLTPKDALEVIVGISEIVPMLSGNAEVRLQVLRDIYQAIHLVA